MPPSTPCRLAVTASYPPRVRVFRALIRAWKGKGDGVFPCPHENPLARPPVYRVKVWIRDILP